jgi:hypothetical protein
MIETVGIIETWLWSTLSADSDLMTLVNDSLSGTLSSEQLSIPYVTFLMQSSRDVVGHNGDRISTDNLYVVKGVTEGGSWDLGQPIAERIDFLLHRPTAVMQSGGGSLTCVREQIIEYPEVEEGLQYRHLGGIYRIRASADD